MGLFHTDLALSLSPFSPALSLSPTEDTNLMNHVGLHRIIQTDGLYKLEMNTIGLNLHLWKCLETKKNLIFF